MSISGVSSSDVFQASVAQGAQTKLQQIQSQFQKVGQDLQSGNLTQAQADFATLSQELPSAQQAGGSTATGPTKHSNQSLPGARPGFKGGQPRGPASRFRNDPARRAAANFRPGARPPSPSRRRLQPGQQPTGAGPHFARHRSAIRKSFLRAAGVRNLPDRCTAGVSKLQRGIQRHRIVHRGGKRFRERNRLGVAGFASVAVLAERLPPIYQSVLRVSISSCRDDTQFPLVRLLFAFHPIAAVHSE